MSRQGGFTYLGLLFAIAFLGLLTASAGEVWHVASQRDREEELLFVGQQFSNALASYRAATPVEPKQFPRRLEDLLEDRRGPTMRRHLRKIFVDPMTGGTEWGLVKVGDGITGVYSLAEGRPLKRANFSSEGASFSNANSYRDWRFLATADSAGKDQ
jgi:type II secretory pathway pseudopilin PulG